MKTERFYYVNPAKGRIAHIADSITEGNQTRCGRRMWLGWKWMRIAPARKLCQRCLDATTATGAKVHIQRVRAAQAPNQLGAA
jgi:hypothetical protein